MDGDRLSLIRAIITGLDGTMPPGLNIAEVRVA
jgi:hypothetical protein